MRAAKTLERGLQAIHHALGPVIAEALADAQVVEVMVNPDGLIWVDRMGTGRHTVGELDRSAAETVLRCLADHAGVTVTRDHPLVSATLPVTGERFMGTFPPITAAPSFAIRKRPTRIFGIDDYLAQGIMTAEQAATIRAAVASRQNILIIGGTGSGKTTLANAILAEPAIANDRVVMIEDTPELQCSATDTVSMVTKTTDPVVTMADLVKATLRLRPDRIIIGEVRDGAALDMVKAWNTGHPGGLATLHANSPLDALYRIEDLIGEVVSKTPQRQIAAAINIIVQIRRTSEGRRVDEVKRVHLGDSSGYNLA
ncbi:MAG: P-type conjugative transfer ATPase TrbB [Zavarzinia sp.]|nr:P-type conjugative transfer ATPase TrbB [Zavarzinia sp.]